MRATRFSDVCGTIDELKRVVYEEPQTVATSPESLAALFGDALFMLQRMEPRLHEYQRFRAEVVALATALQEMGDAPRYDPAAPLLEALLQRGQVLGEDERAAVVAEAEAIRNVAIDLEKRLYRYKDLALALGRAYRDIQGSRSWVLDGDEAETAAGLPGQPAWARWLPPSPHRERILRYLRAARAHLVSTGDIGDGWEQPPLLEFEDGGALVGRRAQLLPR
jgi:hypothetical protein